MTSFWDAFVTKLRSCFYFCCPWARSSTPVDYQQQSSCNTSCYEAIQKDKTSHAIELNDVDYGAIPKVDVEASRGPTNHQFIRFSQQSKAEPGEKQLTEKALRELNRLDKTYKADEETTDKNIFPHPIDLTAIHPWLNTVAPMDEATSREMEYLVGTYEEEYEKIEKSVPPPSPGSLTPSLASYKSNKSAYHIDRIGGATQIRYSKTTEAEGSAQKDRGGVKYMKTGRTVKQRDRMPNLQQTDIILRTGVIDEPAKPPVFDQALQTGYRGDYSKTRRALDKVKQAHCSVSKNSQ